MFYILLKIVSETIDNGGTVVIPSFAVGRTQEILYEINKIKENRHDEEFLRIILLFDHFLYVIYFHMLIP